MTALWRLDLTFLTFRLLVFLEKQTNTHLLCHWNVLYGLIKKKGLPEAQVIERRPIPLLQTHSPGIQVHPQILLRKRVLIFFRLFAHAGSTSRSGLSCKKFQGTSSSASEVSETIFVSDILAHGSTTRRSWPQCKVEVLASAPCNVGPQKAEAIAPAPVNATAR